MPGVPSGRGCEGCRKQKKKCDQRSPSCSRCTRLGLICIGAGRRRFKFMEQNFHQNGSVSEPILSRHSSSSSSFSDRSFESVPSPPSNDSSLLLNAFVGLIKPSIDLRYNLAWTYGGFMRDIPLRLGRNEALDAAALVTVHSHNDFCTGNGVTVDGLAKYSEALKMLRFCLDDPVKAKMPETLGAVMLLLISQEFMKLVEGGFTGHCEGIAQIIKARGAINTQDSFETKLLMSMRGPVIFEGLFNSKIRFTAQEWREIAKNPLDGKLYEGKLMRCLAILPYFIETRNSGTTNPPEDVELVNEIWTNYQEWRPEIATLREQLTKLEVELANRGPTVDWGPLVQQHAYIKRSYGLALAIAIILNSVLSGTEVDQTHLLSEGTYFAEEALMTSKDAEIYRPLGSSYVPLCLSTAWVGTTDPALRLRIQEALDEHRTHYGWGQRGKLRLESLEWTAKRLRLQNPDPSLLSKIAMPEVE